MAAYLGEFLGTALLVLLGDGICANVNLNKSGFKGGGLVIITLGWGLAVMLPAMIFSGICAASYNPALTIALCIDGTLPWSICAGYIIAEMLGGFVGAVLVWITFKPQFDATEDGALTRGCFCTAPSARNIPYNILQEAIATFWLVFAIKGLGNLGAIDGGVGKFLVGAIIVSCGMSFGGLTGYAMNPARDTAPRIAYAVLPIKGKVDADWGYAIVPIVGPIIGAIVAVLLFSVIPWA
ncbi:MAG: aquaporin family protein [Eubacterium sp.]|nr:aquaporin family protein [Eubacterium sp.]MDD7209032.1 aquaporin family protein [Lachnospiraceae bacterium]MDY5497271.1 MIP/aquaporin family protein [Anaerobutyricum sp.]